MSILCKMFGHRLGKGWMGGPKYLDPVFGEVDGLGRRHIRLYSRCDRCNSEYLVGMTSILVKSPTEKSAERMMRAKDQAKWGF